MKVIKRDGTRVTFCKEKIINAVTSANNEVDEEFKISDRVINNIANEIEEYCSTKKKSQTVETIQNLVELKLMEKKAFELAKHYIEYRHTHKMARDGYTMMMDTIDEKLGAKNIQNQNANLDEASFGGRIGETISYIDKKYALNYCMTEMSRNNHVNNEIYIHK